MILAKFKNVQEPIFDDFHQQNFYRLFDDWKKHFKNLIGFSPWALQELWAKRVLLGRSFTILAPTGIGKTTFGFSMATFLKDRSYIIFPTKLLVRQAWQKLKNLGYEKEILAVFKSDDETKDKIKSGKFKILITTSMFFYKNYQIIPQNIKFFFIDDVDAFLKTAKNVDKILYLMGFDELTITQTFQLIKLKLKKNKTDNDLKIIDNLQQSITLKKQIVQSILVVSSATATPKSYRVRLFKELLDFEISKPIFYLRNITDVITYKHSDKDLIEYVKKFKQGGLIFISADKGKEEVQRIVTLLANYGIKAVSYEFLDEKLLKKFEKGKIDVLVGISSYKNPLARGIDLPLVIKYAIFYGVPKIIVKLNLLENYKHLIWVLTSISSKIKDKRIDQWLEKLKTKHFDDNLKNEILQFLSSSEIKELIEQSNEIFFDGNNLIVADVVGYLQASGRTSRLYAGILTHGLSLILVDNQKALNNLLKKARWFVNDINFCHEKDINYDEILLKINQDRRRIADIAQTGIIENDVLKPVIVIVESPNKARTIAKFFGKPLKRKVLNLQVYEIPIGDYYLSITASLGHIFDLTKNEGIYGVEKNSMFIPIYEPLKGKEDLVKSLKLLSFEYDYIFIATDPDTEGEKIAWDIFNLINSPDKKIQRMEFHEITKRAILHALQYPRQIDENLTKAQIVRRIADRWVGFELSKIIQKKFNNNKLSAGRVQTPVLGWIIDQFNQSLQKIPVVDIYINKIKLRFTFDNSQEAKDFFNFVKNIRIEKIKEEIEELQPPPPFRTDTLLKEAAKNFKFSLPKTMQLAQDLFELGLITYHRSDSIRVSDIGSTLAQEYILENFGNASLFHWRKWQEGGAHECIRPTRNLTSDDLRSLVSLGKIPQLSNDHLRLYSLIFQRFIASQMKETKIKVDYFRVKALNYIQDLKLNSNIIENGFNLIMPLKIYQLNEGDFFISSNNKILRFLPLNYPHTYASIVALMKERNIGRPSTYSSIVEKLLKRHYIYEKKGFLLPTRLGKIVFNFLNNLKEKEFFIKEEFTRYLEDLMDKIEDGNQDYQVVLNTIYQNLFEFKNN